MLLLSRLLVGHACRATRRRQRAEGRAEAERYEQPWQHASCTRVTAPVPIHARTARKRSPDLQPVGRSATFGQGVKLLACYSFPVFLGSSLGGAAKSVCH